MNGTAGYPKGVAEVLSLLEEERFDKALKRLEDLKNRWPGNAQLYILWARVVQLQDESAHSLGEAKRALQQAIEFDKQSPAATIELGYFLDNVEDNPQGAAKVFAQGVSAARGLLIEGLLGEARSLIQLNRREDAVRCLVEAHQLADAERSSWKSTFTTRIEELLTELGQMQSA